MGLHGSDAFWSTCQHNDGGACLFLLGRWLTFTALKYKQLPIYRPRKVNSLVGQLMPKSDLNHRSHGHQSIDQHRTLVERISTFSHAVKQRVSRGDDGRWNHKCWAQYKRKTVPDASSGNAESLRTTSNENLNVEEKNKKVHQLEVAGDVI